MIQPNSYIIGIGFYAISTLCGFAQNTFPSSGNVGVGTTSPQVAFDVNGTIYATKTSAVSALQIRGGWAGSPRLQIYGLEADGNAWMGFGADMAGGPYEHSIYFPGLDAGPLAGAGKLTIGDYNGSVYHNRFTIRQNGNVGIGIDNPAAPLTVSSPFGKIDTSLRGVLALQSNDASNQFAFDIYFNGSSAQNTRTVVLQTSERNIVNGGTLALQSYGGNVGIGTNSPGTKLEISISGSSGQFNDVLTLTSAPVVVANANGSGLLFKTTLNDGAGFNTVGAARIYTSLTNGSMGAEFDSLIFQTMRSGTLTDAMTIAGTGNVGIGTTAPSHKLAVNGTIKAKEIIVETTGWSDYVFAPGYRLMPLSEVERSIQVNGHLPNIPSAAQVAEKGIGVGEMQALLLAKIEELTLHSIRQEKLLAQQSEIIEQQQRRLNQIEAKEATP